jgi:hypothetical protein
LRFSVIQQHWQPSGIHITYFFTSVPLHNRVPQVHFINPWLLGEKYTPIIIRDADKALHFVFSETLARLRRGLLTHQEPNTASTRSTFLFICKWTSRIQEFTRLRCGLPNKIWLR